eukprot:GHRR01006221.1.p1 GENE.GHRR01006221.1~~GHRR01006221.1.p1  ORF type:complete len:126 (-),score=31.63 GHRR01006221.1:892-1269(-)
MLHVQLLAMYHWVLLLLLLPGHAPACKTVPLGMQLAWPLDASRVPMLCIYKPVFAAKGLSPADDSSRQSSSVALACTQKNSSNITAFHKSQALLTAILCCSRSNSCSYDLPLITLIAVGAILVPV